MAARCSAVPSFSAKTAVVVAQVVGCCCSARGRRTPASARLVTAIERAPTTSGMRSGRLVDTGQVCTESGDLRLKILQTADRWGARNNVDLRAGCGHVGEGSAEVEDPVGQFGNFLKRDAGGDRHDHPDVRQETMKEQLGQDRLVDVGVALELLELSKKLCRLSVRKVIS